MIKILSERVGLTQRAAAVLGVLLILGMNGSPLVARWEAESCSGTVENRVMENRALDNQMTEHRIIDNQAVKNQTLAWSVVDSWRVMVKAQPQSTASVKISHSSPAAWSTIESWTGTVKAPAGWSVVETWTGTVKAPAAWQMVESWSGTIKAPAPPDFSVSVSPTSGEVEQGGSVMATVTVTPGGSYDSPVSLTASRQPSGVTVTFSPENGIPSFTSTAILTSFSLSIDPKSASVEQGRSVAVAVLVVSENGYSKPVNLGVVADENYFNLVGLNVDWLPGAELSLSPRRGTPTFTSTLMVSARCAPVGTYGLTIRGVGTDGMERSSTFELEVTPVRETIKHIEAGENFVSDLRERDLPVTGMTITAAQTIADMTFLIEILADKPADAPDFEYLEYFDIEVSGEAVQIKRALIEFRVARSWIEQNGVDGRTIRLLRLQGLWEELPTELIGADENFMYFEAITLGFSLFAVVGEKTAVPAPPPVGLPWLPLAALSAFGVGLSGFSLCYTFFRCIRPLVPLELLKRISSRGMQMVEPVEVGKADARCSNGSGGTTEVERPIALALEGFESTVIWEPKPLKARVSKRAKVDAERLKRLWRATNLNYHPKLRRERARFKNKIHAELLKKGIRIPKDPFAKKRRPLLEELGIQTWEAELVKARNLSCHQ